MNDVGCKNTDKEIWREKPGDYYSDSICVTSKNGIGMNCGDMYDAVAASLFG